MSPDCQVFKGSFHLGTSITLAHNLEHCSHVCLPFHGINTDLHLHCLLEVQLVKDTWTKGLEPLLKLGAKSLFAPATTPASPLVPIVGYNL